MRMLNIDLDGCVFDFEQHFFNCFGIRLFTVDARRMWELIESRPNFYRDMPLMVDAHHLIRRVGKVAANRGMGVRFLGALNANHSPKLTNIPKDKLEALHEHFSTEIAKYDIEFAFSRGSPSKARYCRPGDILIDDYQANCLAWRAQGGHAFWYYRGRDPVDQFPLSPFPKFTLELSYHLEQHP